MEIRGHMENIQTTSLLISIRILRRVLVTCCHSDFCEKPSANAHVKNLEGVIIIIIIMIIIITLLGN